MSNARFSILQARAVKDKRISDSQFRTLAALGMYADQDGWCYPALGTLGKDLSKSKQAVGRDTIALRKLGYLEVRPRFDNKGSRRSSLYRLKYDLPPVNVDDSTPSTPEVDTPSTPEVDVNDPSNDQKNSGDSKNTAYRRGEQEAPDMLSQWLAMANAPGMKQQAKIDALLSAYGVAFVVNSETSDFKKLAKHAISEQTTKGWNPAVFIEWVRKQKGFADGFWSARRMFTEYPKAYTQAPLVEDWQDRSHAL